MIIVTDEQIEETIFDNTPLSITLLKKFGWTLRVNVKFWMTFTKRDVKDVQITRFSNGDYFLESEKRAAIKIHTVGDLREKLKFFNV